jgi:hypothetical protein
MWRMGIVVSYGDSSDERPSGADPDMYQSATRLARKLSSSIKTFPGVVIEMTRLDDGRWHNNMKLMGQ